MVVARYTQVVPAVSRYVMSPTVLTYSDDSLRRLCVLMLHATRMLRLGSVGHTEVEKDKTRYYTNLLFI